MRVDAIPSNKLETVKDWLTSCKIKYYESKLNLAWKPILRSIVEDPEQFIADGKQRAAGLRGVEGCGRLLWRPVVTATNRRGILCAVVVCWGGRGLEARVASWARAPAPRPSHSHSHARSHSRMAA